MGTPAAAVSMHVSTQRWLQRLRRHPQPPGVQRRNRNGHVIRRLSRAPPQRERDARSPGLARSVAVAVSLPGVPLLLAVQIRLLLPPTGRRHRRRGAKRSRERPGEADHGAGASTRALKCIGDLPSREGVQRWGELPLGGKAEFGAPRRRTVSELCSSRRRST